MNKGQFFTNCNEPEMPQLALDQSASSAMVRGGSHLRYASIDDLPPVRSHLLLHAQEIYLAAFNNAWMECQSHGLLSGVSRLLIALPGRR